jgi:hypothetical protein
MSGPVPSRGGPGHTDPDVSDQIPGPSSPTQQSRKHKKHKYLAGLAG